MEETVMSTGEPDGVRLLELARRELLDNVLPELSGDSRYRARLIANAMKVAARELAVGQGLEGESAEELAAFAQGAPLADGGASAARTAAAIRLALRAGHLDGDPALYDLIGRITRRRQALLG
jgi:hypothetical protein